MRGLKWEAAGEALRFLMVVEAAETEEEEEEEKMKQPRWRRRRRRRERNLPKKDDEGDDPELAMVAGGTEVSAFHVVGKSLQVATPEL